MEFLSLQEGLLGCSVESLHFTICLGMIGTDDVMFNVGQLIEFLTDLKSKLRFLGIHEIKFIKKFLGIHEIKCINSEHKGMYIHLIDKLPFLVRYMNPGSSIMADKLIHELGHTFSTFPYQGLRLNEFTCVVYAGDDGVVPHWSLRLVQVSRGTCIDFSLFPPFSNLEPAFTHWHASQLSTNLHLVYYVWKVNFG